MRRHSSPVPASGEQAVYLVIENGGTVSDREAAMVTIRATLAELVELRRRRDTRHAVIRIVLTANPTEITWTGTPDDLQEKGLKVLNLISFKNTCSDLVRAWSQVDLAARISRPDDMLLIISMGGMILFWVFPVAPPRSRISPNPRRFCHHSALEG